LLGELEGAFGFDPVGEEAAGLPAQQVRQGGIDTDSIGPQILRGLWDLKPVSEWHVLGVEAATASVLAITPPRQGRHPRDAAARVLAAEQPVNSDPPGPGGRLRMATEPVPPVPAELEPMAEATQELSVGSAYSSKPRDPSAQVPVVGMEARSNSAMG
jgi:hypothetical protein